MDEPKTTGQVKARDHWVEKPVFGVPPAPDELLPRVPKYEFEDLLDMVRERPGEWAKIGVYKGSNRKKVLAETRASRARLWRFLVSRCPLEEWNLSTRPTPDTWCDRELWVRYRGTMTVEEAMKLQTIREQAYSKDAFPNLEPKARKEQRNHARRILKDREIRRQQPPVG